jgi:hypothetical protein
MQGNYPQELRRAGASKADKIVFLCHPDGKQEDNLFGDAHNVLAARVAESNNAANCILSEFCTTNFLVHF